MPPSPSVECGMLVGMSAVLEILKVSTKIAGQRPKNRYYKLASLGTLFCSFSKPHRK